MFIFDNMTTAAGIHYNDVRMGAMASQINSLTIVYTTFYSGAEMFPFDDVIMTFRICTWFVSDSQIKIGVMI